MLKSTERLPDEVACHTEAVAPSPLAHPTKAYLHECVEEKFCELRLYGVLRSCDENPSEIHRLLLAWQSQLMWRG